MNVVPSFLFLSNARRFFHTPENRTKGTHMPRVNPGHPQFAVRSSAARLVVAALPVLALSLLAGCGAKSGDVSGKVYYKGKVVTSGFVTMVGSDGTPRNSEIAEDGSYQVLKVPVGEAKVAVSSPAFEVSKGFRPAPKREGAPANEEAGATLTENQKKTWVAIPIRYSDITKSDLKHTVTAGANTKDIKLD